MKTKLLLLLITLVGSAFFASAQETFDKELGANINYNALGGDASFSNITPQVFYGWRTDLAGTQDSNEHLVLRAGPFVSAQPQIKDSSEFLPGLMLPGNAGLDGDLYYFRRGKRSEFMLNAGVGLKVMSNFLDSSNSIWQNNFRLGAGFRFDDLFMLTGTYTWGNHNISSIAEDNFAITFGAISSKVQYLHLNLQIKVNGQNTDDTNHSYFVLSWRSFMENGDLKSLPNNRIISIGFRKNIDFTSANKTFI